MNGISIIIPIFNEAENLPTLLGAIESQTLQPNEVILVDSGSSDNTDQIIAQHQDLNNNFSVRHIKNHRGMPGGNRNKGILESNYDWIAFIDAGIIPSNRWLEVLMECATQNNSKAIFGNCLFTGTTEFSHAVCAVSYGCTSHPVIPASIFHKDVFKRIGGFPEQLRAAEDTIWLKSFDSQFSPRITTRIHVATYNSFPKTISELIRKYLIYEKSLISVDLGKEKAMILTSCFFILLITAALYLHLAIMLLLAYLVMRGVLDPVRRSRSLFWWYKFPASVFLAPICAVFIDVTILFARNLSRLNNKT